MGMKAISLAVILAACGGSGPSVGDDVVPPPPGGDGSVTPPEPDANLACTGVTSTDVAGKITANQTWSDNINLTASINIAAGVTVTVMPGTIIHIPENATIGLAGTLDIQGTKQCTVVGRSTTPGQFWQGISVVTGGELIAHYYNQTGGGIHTTGTGKATIIDSTMSNCSGDWLVMGGGTVDVEYSWIGVEEGLTDTSHCDLHFGGTAANTIKVTHTNLSTSSYGMMFYNGLNADLTFNNWFGNLHDIDTTVAMPVTGDLSNGWFERGAPAIQGLTANNMATARLSDAGPR